MAHHRVHCPVSPTTAGVVREHAALARYLGNLQESVSKLVREKEAEVQALSREVVQLRAQLLLSRTSKLWQMG